MDQPELPIAFPRSVQWLWFSLTLFVIIALVMWLPLLPNDYWWYVRVGQDTMRQQAIPQIDTFSYTQAGQLVVYHSWLAALIFWWLYSAGGTPFTFLLRALILGAAYGGLWLLARRAGAGPRLASVCVLIAALAGGSNWSVRPQLFGYALFVVCLWVLYLWQRGNTRWLWLLPVVSCLWVNLHGSFVIMLLLAGVALVCGDGPRRKLALWLGLASLATLINPRGPGAWMYVVNLLRDPASQIYSAEWSPPAFDNWQTQIFFVWLLIFPLLAASSRRRLARLEWGWFLGFGLMALSGLRYVVWFLFLLVPFTARLLADGGRKYLDRPVSKTLPALNVSVAVILFLIAFALLPGVRDSWWRGQPIPVYGDTPVAATEWLAQHPDRPGPLWADLSYSSYLIFALPSRPVWIDTRFEVYPPQQFKDYLAISAAQWGWDTLLDRSGVNLLLLSRTDQPQLIQAVQQKANSWCQDYADDQSVIFSRCGK